MIPIRVVFKNNDEKLLKIDELIEAKRQMLQDKQKTIGKIYKQNKFLEDVKNDYENYNSIIMKQKQDQIDAFSLLNKYIEDLKVSGELSKENIKDSNEEQKKILNEINDIKKKLELNINEDNNK